MFAPSNQKPGSNGYTISSTTKVSNTSYGYCDIFKIKIKNAKLLQKKEKERATKYVKLNRTVYIN